MPNILDVSESRIKKSVKNWMERENLSKTAASRKAGLSYPYFCGILNGKQKMSERVAITLLHSSKKLVKKNKKKN